MTDKLLETAFSDMAIGLNGISMDGDNATAADVARMHKHYLKIPAKDRHLFKLCVMRFDGNPIFESDKQ